MARQQPFQKTHRRRQRFAFLKDKTYRDPCFRRVWDWIIPRLPRGAFMRVLITTSLVLILSLSVMSADSKLIPPMARVNVAPTDGFSQYVSDALVKKNVPVVIGH